jgi:hypothetical protein
MWTIPFVTADALTRTVQDFLSEASGAVVLENGAVAFDLSQAKYSISGEFNKVCCTCGQPSAIPSVACLVPR